MFGTFAQSARVSPSWKPWRPACANTPLDAGERAVLAGGKDGAVAPALVEMERASAEVLALLLKLGEQADLPGRLARLAQIDSWQAE
ncbi:hypothetical protein [Crenobacter caeni]|uniref:Uncharacterized protein n=1 Tax=Crenobacter caeni TaxID=2705474 RepID=A0A6B2KSL6_9NEIS|nr:hypothetical protein [Crenobacter caeni]NDV13236.1 hypothetical protein [Crenobacter caeni]